MKNTFLITGTVAIMVMAAACTKEPLKNLSEDESRIYITNHDDSVSFSGFKTFSIADSVAVVDNNRLKGKAGTHVDTAYINAVRSQMVPKRYNEVSHTSGPDLGVVVKRGYNIHTGMVE